MVDHIITLNNSNDLIINDGNLKDSLERFLNVAYRSFKKNDPKCLDNLDNFLSIVAIMPSFNTKDIDSHLDSYFDSKGLSSTINKSQIQDLLEFCLEKKSLYQTMDLIDLLRKIDPQKTREVLIKNTKQITDIFYIFVNHNLSNEFATFLDTIKKVDPDLTKEIVNSLYNQTGNAFLHTMKAAYYFYVVCEELQLSDPRVVKRWAEYDRYKLEKTESQITPAYVNQITPLFYFVSKNDCTLIIQKLLEAGADPLLTNQQGLNAHDFAKEFVKKKVLDPIHTDPQTRTKLKSKIFELLDSIHIPPVAVSQTRVLSAYERDQKQHSKAGSAIFTLLQPSQPEVLLSDNGAGPSTSPQNIGNSPQESLTANDLVIIEDYFKQPERTEAPREPAIQKLKKENFIKSFFK